MHSDIFLDISIGISSHILFWHNLWHPFLTYRLTFFLTYFLIFLLALDFIRINLLLLVPSRGWGSSGDRWNSMGKVSQLDIPCAPSSWVAISYSLIFLSGGCAGAIRVTARWLWMSAPRAAQPTLRALLARPQRQLLNFGWSASDAGVTQSLILIKTLGQIYNQYH